MTPPSVIAHYRITGKLGEGGMGAVYRATDTKLNRDVAIKVLPDAFAADPDRMARFTREAQLLASLNHPNIAAIYGVEERALVMELVEGETLAGPLPMDEVLPIARQLVEAMEYAHDRGIIHRDLKPANIKITPEGRVKVLDFGLAKALSGDPAQGDPASSPTLTMRATVAGTIMGTAAYMSPEQAKGKRVDRRADIWAFGVVLYELLTGRRLFDGETISDVLAAVLKTDPDWSALPLETPSAVRRLLRRCLERDPARRLPNIGVARLELEERDVVPPPTTIRRSRSWLWPAIAGVFLAAGAALAVIHFREVSPDPPLVRFPLTLPEKTVFNGHVAVSPDGSRIAISASSTDGRSLIWIRHLDRLDWQALPGTDNAGFMFWSADSQSLAFWSDNKLLRVEARGGPVQTICDTGVALSGTWSADGVILFGSTQGVLYRVPASGGVPVAISHINLRTETNNSHPVLLPDGRHILYHVQTVRLGDSAIYVAGYRPNGEIEAGKRLTLSQTGGRYLPGPNHIGHILIIRGETLMAQKFDEVRLQGVGDAVSVAERAGSFLARPFMSISQTGVLAYWSGGNVTNSLVTSDRKGNPVAPPIHGDFAEVALSPEGTRAAVAQRRQGSFDVSVIDLRSGASMRIPSETGPTGSPVWSRDGKQIAFATGGADGEIHVRLSSGAGNEEILKGPPSGRTIPTDWSPDGKFVLVESGPLALTDLSVLPMTGDRKPYPYLNTVAAESQGVFSPDGKFVAYVSNETGRSEVYVQQFPPRGGKWPVSSGGGSQPRWPGDGKEIFYVDPDRNLMAASVTMSPDFRTSTPTRLFNVSMFTALTRFGQYRYDVTRDRQRFLINTMDLSTSSGQLNVVLNWQPGK